MALAKRTSRWTLRLVLMAATPLAPALAAQQPDTGATAGLLIHVRDKDTGHAVVNARVAVGPGGPAA